MQEVHSERLFRMLLMKFRVIAYLYLFHLQTTETTMELTEIVLLSTLNLLLQLIKNYSFSLDTS